MASLATISNQLRDVTSETEFLGRSDSHLPSEKPPEDQLNIDELRVVARCLGIKNRETMTERSTLLREIRRCL